MNNPAMAQLQQDHATITPVIERGITGPHQQPGFLLRAPRLETLIWDLEREIASTRQFWQEDRGAWWIASSYLDTAIQIVLRSFPSVLVLNEADHDHLFSRDGRTMVQQRLL
jgi:hypothetical protein